MKLAVRTFDVTPNAPAAAPTALPDRHVEADTVDGVRNKAAELFAAERRPVRSLSFLADGGLVAYVLPQLPELEPAERPKRKRRAKGRR